MAKLRDAIVQGIAGGAIGAAIGVLIRLALSFGFGKAEIATIVAAAFGAATPVAAVLWIEAEKHRARRIAELGMIPGALDLLSEGLKVLANDADNAAIGARLDSIETGWTMLMRAINEGAVIGDPTLFKALMLIQRYGTEPIAEHSSALRAEAWCSLEYLKKIHAVMATAIFEQVKAARIIVGGLY